MIESCGWRDGRNRAIRVPKPFENTDDRRLRAGSLPVCGSIASISARRQRAAMASTPAARRARGALGVFT
jgi:hypothetical protein